MTTTRYTVSPPWLAGGIDAAHCIAAYVPRGAHSYNDSLVNRAAPGMFTLSDVVNDYDCEPQVMTPNWSAAGGWEFINPRTENDNSDSPVMALHAPITSADIGGAGGTVLAIAEFGAQTADNACVVCSYHSTYPELIWALCLGQGAVDGQLSWHIRNGAERIEGDIGTPFSGMLAASDRAAYVNGVYTPDVLPLPADGLCAGLNGFGIGAYYAEDYRENCELYYPWYSGWGMTGNVHAVAFYRTALTAVQLDAIRAAFAAYWADAGTPARTFASKARTTSLASKARVTTFASEAR